jgi:hypothetical protein
MTNTPANYLIEPTDADAFIELWPASLDTPFMCFWRDLNKIFVAHALPEVLFGEARDLYGRRVDTWSRQ